ncbi:MAG: vWA domain-containing protein [Pyrinomonadaceae bacterium]
MKKCVTTVLVLCLYGCLFGISVPAQTKKTIAVKKIATKNVAKRGTLEMVFVIDTTGSMGGLIDGAKQKVWSIVNDVMQKPSRPAVRVGLVAYRDQGDAYVTQVLPLTDDLDKVYTTLMAYQASGGGDEPENVRRALADGVYKAGWTKSEKELAQIIFLVGDAPPHEDYTNEPDTLTTTAAAVRKNMIVNTIQCGSLAGTIQFWQNIARRGEGKYFAIPQDGGVAAIATPYDARLAELAGKVGETYLAYGGGSGVAGTEFRSLLQANQVTIEARVVEALPVATQADRAVNKAINSSAYAKDLIQDIENETVKLEQVKKEDLPDDLQKLSLAERQKEIEKRLAERKKVRTEILELSKKRDQFIAAERQKTGVKNAFDAAVAIALKDQLQRKGIR